MKTNKLFLAILMLALVAAFSCKKHNANGMSDADITSAVKEKLHESTALAASNIDVHTDNGVVRLDGKVISEPDARRAVQLTSSVPGVVRVDSQLKVDPTITGKDIKDRVHADEQASKKQLEQQTPESEHPVNDAAITTKVKMKLAEDHLLSALEINVDTKNQVVTLTGNVKDETQARRAVEIARAVDGVKTVNSVLTIKH